MNNINNIKVSVIVPIYNAGGRLRQCLDSILSQTLKEIEVICVLDCPTDGSDKVVEEYAEKDSRIIVIKNQTNLHIGESRNVGISRAKGEYLIFSDHDDISLPTMYEDMYNVGISNNADMILGVPEYTYPNPADNETYFFPEQGDVCEKLLECVIGRGKGDSDAWSFYFSHGVIWDKMYKYSMVVGNNIKFVDNKKITFEDNLFVIECCLKANKAIVHNQKVYQHTIEATNTASSSGYTQPDKVVAYINYLYDVLVKSSMQNTYGERFGNSASRYMIGCLTRTILRKKNFRQLTSVLAEFKQIKYLSFIYKHSKYSSLIKESKGLVKKITYTLLYCYLWCKYK
jgi:glycosyltransferase involved in cell wall biosynthesis